MLLVQYVQKLLLVLLPRIQLLVLLQLFILAAGSGAKAAYDYTKEMPDVVFGDFLKELVKRRVLQTQPI